MRRWTIITGILLLCLVVLAGATACAGDKEETSQQLAEVVRGDLTISVSGSGNIETYHEAWLTFGSGGRVAKINVEEGDEVSEGDVLASLDTDSLELAKSQTQVALTQAEVALAQAQLARQTAEFELDATLDKEGTLELALFNAQISLDQAKVNLEQTRDLYTWSDIKAAQADVDEAEDYLEYCLEQLVRYLPEYTEDDAALYDSYPKVLEFVLEDKYPKTPGYEVWQERIIHAKSRLNTAENRLDAMLSGSDIEEVAIKKLQIEAAGMSVAQAQNSLDKLADEIAIKELQVQVAKDSVGQARQSVALAKQSLNDAQKDIDEATITAPLTGVVANVYVKEGDLIPAPTMAPQTIFHLIDPTSMELIVEMDEIDVPDVKLAQEAIIEIDALPDDEFEGRVTTIYPLPTTVGGVVLYNVKIKFDVPSDSGIKVGMSASADIITDKRSNALLVPSRAIKEDEQGNPIVRVIADEQTQERQVVTGISDDLETEIISGLTEGEMVLVEIRAKAAEEGIGFF